MGDVIWLEILTTDGNYSTFKNVNISIIGDYMLISKSEENYITHQIIGLSKIKSYKTKTE